MSCGRASRVLCLAAMLAAVAAAQGSALAGMKLTSPAFSNGRPIPAKHSLDGGNLSPPLRWTGAPAGTRSLAILVDDSSAGSFSHWVIYNIPVTVKSLSASLRRSVLLARGIRQGRNDFGGVGWGGPQPPPGPAHRYVFRIYALKSTLPAGIATRAALLSAIKGKVLGQTSLVGTFKG